jgi:ubiquinone/menaquinone biosynthesis C-methylase UbiE
MTERRFNPADVWKLEDPERLVWLPPDEVVGRLDLAPGNVVADVGAGTGYFSLPIARAIAPGGIVWAIDVQPEMLELLAVKLRDQRESPHDIELQQGDATHTGLHTHSCDLALLANVWHEFEDHDAALHEAARILKPDGRLAILDWRPGVDRPPGPPLEHRISVEQATASLRDNGWQPTSSTLVGRYSYLVIAAAPKP